MITAVGFEWLAEYASGWQFGEQGILQELCNRLGVTCGYEVGAGDGEALPVTLAFMPTVVLFELDHERRSKLAAKYKNATIKGGFNESDANEIQSLSCVVVDVDSCDWMIAESILDHCTPSIMMIEHYDRLGPYMVSRVETAPLGRLPNWVLGMRLDSGFVLQQPFEAICDEMQKRRYSLVASSRVNGIYVHCDKIKELSYA